jgi:sulfur carrier protein
MKIRINGKDESFELAALSVKELLSRAKVETPEMVSVQLNGEFLKREDFAKRQVEDGDEVDFLYFMGGGKTR